MSAGLKFWEAQGKKVAPARGAAKVKQVTPSVPQNAPRTRAGSKRELTPAQFFQIAAALQAQARRQRGALPAVSRAKTPAMGGL